MRQEMLGRIGAAMEPGDLLTMSIEQKDADGKRTITVTYSGEAAEQVRRRMEQ